ncbi:MAG TPA: hypothetical protein VK922_13365 [Gemmatimonadaceae bacterium]|nr:hypothetical protein [Gemmatimonadaceae bacterium]
MFRHRWKYSVLLAALAIAPSAAALAQQPPQAAQPAPPPARPADVESVDAIIAAVYDVISGPAGQTRDWDRMRSLFVPGARLIPIGRRQAGGFGARVMTIEDYVTVAGPSLERDGFFEREIGRVTERYGNLVHAFSAYDSKRTLADPQPFMRGINSIQLMHDGTRWWIVTILWESERPDNPIPEKYLSKNPT